MTSAGRRRLEFETRMDRPVGELIRCFVGLNRIEEVVVERSCRLWLSEQSRGYPDIKRDFLSSVNRKCASRCSPKLCKYLDDGAVHVLRDYEKYGAGSIINGGRVVYGYGSSVDGGRWTVDTAVPKNAGLPYYYSSQ
jgi:hypothetical protein